MKQFDRERGSTRLHSTPGVMSTSGKQERTICVLLPNKDQLDVTVGVSAYSSAALTFFPSYSLFAAVFLLTVDAFVSSPAPAKVHGSGRFQSGGGAPRNQRAALLRPHGGER